VKARFLTVCALFILPQPVPDSVNPWSRCRHAARSAVPYAPPGAWAPEAQSSPTSASASVLFVQNVGQLPLAPVFRRVAALASSGLLGTPSGSPCLSRSRRHLRSPGRDLG